MNYDYIIILVGFTLFLGGGLKWDSLRVHISKFKYMQSLYYKYYFANNLVAVFHTVFHIGNTHKSIITE